MRSMKPLMFLLCFVSLLPACNFSTAPPAESTGSPEAATATVTSMPTASLTPAAVSVVQPQLETAVPTATAAPPTITPTPSETPGPYEHTIRSGETLGFIVQLYGYSDLSTGPGSIIDQVVRLNENIPNADILPGEGSVILIPRQTATPTPGNVETEVAVQATNTASQPNVVLPGGAGNLHYIVQAGDTVISIAQEYNVTLEIIAVLNPELNFFSCNFEIPSGGPNCNVPLQVGQTIFLPAPTPTPTLSPTPSGSETPTPTPTYAAPRLVYPPQNASAPPVVFSLQWVSVGTLRPEEFYLVEVVDVTANSQPFRDLTKDTAYLLPETLIPADGQTHTFNWTVRVVTPSQQGGSYRPIGSAPEVRAFQWQSR